MKNIDREERSILLTNRFSLKLINKYDTFIYDSINVNKYEMKKQAKIKNFT